MTIPRLSDISSRSVAKTVQVFGFLASFAIVPALAIPFISTEAIAQTEPPSSPPSEMEPDALPTENAGSADLVTEPASTSLVQLVELEVPAMPIEDAEEEINRKTPARVFEPSERPGEPGPAQPDRVQFLLE